MSAICAEGMMTDYGTAFTHLLMAIQIGWAGEIPTPKIYVGTCLLLIP